MQLTIKQKMFSIGDKYTITNEMNEGVYKVVAKFFSLHAIRHLVDANGNRLYTLKAKLFRLLPEFEMLDANGKVVAVIKKKFSLLQKLSVQTDSGIFTVNGDLWALNYEVNKDGNPVARVNKKFLSIRDTYTLDIFEDNDAAFLVAFTMVIDLLLARSKSSRS